MTLSINSLWPSQIRANIQSPFAILQGQADALSKQTGGLLLGKITRGKGNEGKVSLLFDIVVPALGDYQHRVMIVAHGTEMVYPASVDAETFRPSGLQSFRTFLETQESFLTGAEGKKPANRADSDQELTEMVAKVLQSPYVVSAAQSLIARANDALAAKEREIPSNVEACDSPASGKDAGLPEGETLPPNSAEEVLPPERTSN